MSTYAFTSDHQHNLSILLRHTHQMSDAESTKIEDIVLWCWSSGKITHKQMQFAGLLYKKYVQRGSFIYHNWRIWK